MKKLVNRYCALGLVLAGSAASAEGVKVGGFVAPAFSWKSKNAGDTSTFNLSDGALYINHTNDTANVVIDIPVSSSGTGNNLNIATTKAQAYLAHKWENGLRWQLGQFDSIYGYEANDLADVPFTSQGRLYGQSPSTHTGLLLGYDFSDMLGVSFLVANPYDTGIRANGQKYDIGAKVSTKVDTYSASVGFLYTKSQPVATPARVLGFDVVLGAKFGEFALNLEALIKKPESGDTALGFGGTGLYAVSDDLGLGARVEWLKDTAGSKVLDLTVGPQYNLNKALQVRADYTFSKPSGTDAGHTIAVAGVYKF